MPLEETTLCRFVAFLFTSSLSHQSICSYLSAVRHMQIVAGGPDPARSNFPRLTYALKGAKRTGSPKQKRVRLPITPDILRKIHTAWSQGPLDADKVMLWAALCEQGSSLVPQLQPTQPKCSHLPTSQWIHTLPPRT